MKTTLRLFALNMLQYFIIAANMRAIAMAWYPLAFVTDMLCGVVAFTLTKRIVEARTWRDRLAFAAGGAIGAQFAIFLTKLAFGS